MVKTRFEWNMTLSFWMVKMKQYFHFHMDAISSTLDNESNTRKKYYVWYVSNKIWRATFFINFWHLTKDANEILSLTQNRWRGWCWPPTTKEPTTTFLFLFISAHIAQVWPVLIVYYSIFTLSINKDFERKVEIKFY